MIMMILQNKSILFHHLKCPDKLQHQVKGCQLTCSCHNEPSPPLSQISNRQKQSHHHHHLTTANTKPPDRRSWLRHNRKSLSRAFIILPFVIALLMLVLSEVSCVVVTHVRFISTKSGREDYAMAGDSIELTCLYVMKDEAEDIKQLVWSKDGKNFLRWRKHKQGLDVLSYTYKGHVDHGSKPNHLIIHNVTIDMHGKYKCAIKTDLGTSDGEQNLVIISHQSNCNDWQVTSQPSQCRELFRFDCRHMFPKPVPSCGLWNGKLDKFIRSVMVDISEETSNKQTYRVRYQGKFELLSNNKQEQLELLQYAGHLMFKCDITVPETSWRLSLVHRMFDYDDGCLENPLETIERMRQNFSQIASARLQQHQVVVPGTVNSQNVVSTRQHQNQGDDYEMLRMFSPSLKYELLSATGNSTSELNCWRKPRHGSLAKLSCSGNGRSTTKLVGAYQLECQPGNGWIPVAGLPSVKNQRPVTRRPRLWQQRTSRRVLASNNDPRGSSHKQQPLDDLEELSTSSSQQSGAANEFEIIPSTNGVDGVDDQLDSSASSSSPMTSWQLAGLLPTCVSTVRATTSAPNSNSVKSINRLPLLDDLQGLNALSSLDGRQQQTTINENQKHGGKQQDTATDWISWFNFTSSSTRMEAKLVTVLLMVFCSTLFLGTR